MSALVPDNKDEVQAHPLVQTKGYDPEQLENLTLFLQPAQNYDTYIQDRSKSRVRRKLFQFSFFVVLTTLVATVYYGWIASDRYTSIFQFTVEASHQTMPTMLDGLLGGASGQTGKETGLLFEYIQSSAMLKELDQGLDLRSHYSEPEVDMLSRLDKNASSEAFLEYYRNLIDVDITTTPGVFTVSVQAFVPAYAQAIGENITSLSEILINQVNQKALNDSVAYSKDDLIAAKMRLFDAQTKLRLFQDAETDLNPAQSSASVASLVSMFEAQLAQANSELSELLTYMRKDSIQVKTLKAKITAIRKQIGVQRIKLAGVNSEGNDRKFSAKLSDFDRILLEVEFAKRAYEASLASLEMAKAEAIRKFSYVVAFVPATLPHAPSEPQRLLMIISVFFGSCFVFMLLSFLTATIQDHIDG